MEHTESEVILEDSTQEAGQEAAELSGEELYSAFEAGASAEELNEKIQGQEAPAQQEDSLPEPDIQNGGEFFKTKEEFQKQFDYEWNKRYSRQMSELEQSRSQLDAVGENLAALLGTTKEQAFAELKKRRYEQEASAQGMDPEHYAKAKEIEAENAALKENLAKHERSRRAESLVSTLRTQAEELERHTPGFDLNHAMQDAEFRATVFANLQVSPEKALERAYRALSAAPEIQQEKAAAMSRRIAEGAAKSTGGGEVKNVDVKHLSSKGILELQDRILRGEHVEL